MSIIEEKLATLRAEYKTASDHRKKQIVAQANLIKKSAHLYKPVIVTSKDFRKPTADEIFSETVKNTLR